MFHPHLCTKEDTKRRSKYILKLIELNFAGIKFRGWSSFCVSRELNFADDPKKPRNSRNLVPAKISSFKVLRLYSIFFC